jgi:hypothetical protein
MTALVREFPGHVAAAWRAAVGARVALIACIVVWLGLRLADAAAAVVLAVAS